jgi:hypothetical protein
MNPGRLEAAETDAVTPVSDETGSNADQIPAALGHDQPHPEPAASPPPISEGACVESEELEIVFAKGLSRTKEQQAFRDSPRSKISNEDRWSDLLANAPRWGKPQPALAGDTRRMETSHYRPFLRKSRTFSDSEMAALCVIPPLPVDEMSRTPILSVSATSLLPGTTALPVAPPPDTLFEEQSPPAPPPPPAMAAAPGPTDIAPEIIIRTNGVEVAVTRESVADETMFVIAGLALPTTSESSSVAHTTGAAEPQQPATAVEISPVERAPQPAPASPPAETWTAAAPESADPGVPFDQWAIGEGAWQAPLLIPATAEKATPDFEEWPTTVPAHATVPETETQSHTQVELELQAAAIKEFSTVQGYLSRILAETINEWLVSSGTKQTRTFVLDAGLLSSSHPIAVTLTMEPASADLVATLIQDTADAGLTLSPSRETTGKISPAPEPAAAGTTAAQPTLKPAPAKADTTSSGFVGGVFATVEKVVDGALGALFGSKPQSPARRPAPASRPQKRRTETGRQNGKLPPKKPQGLRVEVSSRHKL